MYYVNHEKRSTQWTHPNQIVNKVSSKSSTMPAANRASTASSESAEDMRRRNSTSATTLPSVNTATSDHKKGKQVKPPRSVWE